MKHIQQCTHYSDISNLVS